jgi:hypothetical protein
MGKTLDYESRFLESVDNLRRIIKQSVGQELKPKVARDATVCLQHGRLYFEAAERAPLEIKPLVIFYGILNYSMGLVIARELRKFETLPENHSLKDVSPHYSRLEKLKVKCEGKGTFQLFNDSICLLDCVEYKKSNRYEYITTPTAESYLLENKEFTLKDILARIHNLSYLYNATFCEEAKTCFCDISYESGQWGVAKLRIEGKDVFIDSESRKCIIGKLKSRYPFLEKWCLINAYSDLDHSVFEFNNFDCNSCAVISDKGGEGESGLYNVGSSITMGLRSKQYKCVNFWDIIKPTWKDEANRTYFIEPIGGIYISELSLYYLGMFLLSSLVRYRPQIWMRSLSHIVNNDSSSDDAAIALIEKFLDDTLHVFPSAIVRAMNIKTKSSL